MAGPSTNCKWAKGKAAAPADIRIAAAVLTPRILIALAQCLAIGAPTLAFNTNLPNDEELDRQHRHQGFRHTHLTVYCSITDRIFLLVFEVPAFGIEQITHQPIPMNITKAIFDRHSEISRCVFKLALAVAARP